MKKNKTIFNFQNLKISLSVLIKKYTFRTVKNVTLLVFVIIYSCFSGEIYGQNLKFKKDTSEVYGNDEFIENLDSPIQDTIKTKAYSYSLLQKAKKEKNLYKQSDAYYLYARVSEDSIALIYADSIIKATKEKDNFVYPAKAYLLKSNILGSQGNYQKSMDELVQAHLYATKNKNTDQKYETKYSIAILKNYLSEYKESLNILRSTVAYYKTKFEQDNKYEYDYIKSLYALGNSYNVNENYDSTLVVNKKASKLSLKSKDSILYGRLLLTSAVAHYCKKEYQSSLDSIFKLKKINLHKTQSKGTIVRTDLFLGRIYFEQKNFDKSIQHLIKVDSFAFKNQYFFPSITEAYELLIKHFKQKNDKDKQLFYINRLLTVDSILDNDFKYLSREINEKYSTPNLISEKQQIINSLEKKNRIKITIVVILSTLSLLLVLALIRNNRKKKIYKKRFLELLDNKHKITDNPKSKKKEKSETKDIGISDVIVKEILAHLELFEKNDGYLRSNITINDLSKEFKTNSKYLSKVINVHKNKGFSSYINDLRVGYAVEKLKSDPKIRKYTIKAIAEDIGFNTTEAFSKSFYKTTGIYPSFFLKQLEKEYGSVKV
ncbi:helix-turn-helix domain-containing protein [Aquimarina sediminis]|uniref:helix-turn-helix domain-containing protein n=1 Tax=Aquimarina sediminis TaxID=2070536 RepID=UPI000FFF475B|nr:helix-turn-helix domain-containing protein [Aquimarina sediminis]